jgi:filamentous hemagglutinin family protein
VVSGAAGITSAPGLTTITQSTHRAVVDWRSFSIGAGETTRFVQPSAASAILNRVTGGDPSSLLGKLQSNGQVYLVNPNGVLVGPGGQVLTGSFVASTRDVANAQFMQGGALDFAGASGASVVNLGTIRGASGDVHLIAQDVSNGGSISAPNGVAGLASGRSVLLAPEGAEHLLVRPQAVGTGGVVTNTGSIAAAQAELKAAGGNPYALAVNAGGSLTALQVHEAGGKVIISAGSGTAAVSGAVQAAAGANGGTVQVTGANVQVAPTARIQADATGSGNGGRVDIVADGTARFEGAISARGGDAGGDGGQVEVSGHGQLAYAGRVDLRAPRGRTGDLLLDPTDINIVHGPSSGSPISVSGNTSTITDGTIATTLETANVTISTSSAGGGSGDIVFETGTPYSFYTTNSLTFKADRDIRLTEWLIQNGALTLQAGRDIVVTSTFSPGALLNATDLTLVAGGHISIDGGEICAQLPRVFVPNASAFTLLNGAKFVDYSTNVDLALPTVVGKAYGDAGTSAMGLYALSGGSSPSPSPSPAPSPSPVAVAFTVACARAFPRLVAVRRTGRWAERGGQIQAVAGRRHPRRPGRHRRNRQPDDAAAAGDHSRPADGHGHVSAEPVGLVLGRQHCMGVQRRRGRKAGGTDRFVHAWPVPGFGGRKPRRDAGRGGAAGAAEEIFPAVHGRPGRRPVGRPAAGSVRAEPGVRRGQHLEARRHHDRPRHVPADAGSAQEQEDALSFRARNNENPPPCIFSLLSLAGCAPSSRRCSPSAS